ncbi:MAG: SMP-30/gluconolactonase/LRE family protein [SAR202 cluster bacterium]|nr:SMP-30/gluconolactonase/LRE family protein [SAR202 cluster bacterium]
MKTIKSLFTSTKPELLVTGFVFTEGPLWHPDGILYVSDVDAQVHYKVRLEQKVITEVIRDGSGGANGAVFDKDGCLVICEQDARRVVRYEPDGSITVLVDKYGDKRLNRSNDIILHPDGSLYFTDPDKKGLEESDKELGFASIFRINLDGDLVLLANDMNHPNGLGFSVDGKILYVSNSRPDPHLHAYSVDNNGMLNDSRIVAEMPYGNLGELSGVPDGLKLDAEGNIYVTGPGGIWVWDKYEEFLGVIELPELPANIGWGGTDNCTMFVTARTSVYTFKMTRPGIPKQF